MYDVLILSFLTAFTLTYFAIPSIITIARERNLGVVPIERSSHKVVTPSLGGIAIFSGAIFSIVLWTPFGDFASLQYILCAFIILFLLGVKDDLLPISAYTKMGGQIMAAVILVFKSNIQLTSLYGFLNITGTIPLWASATLSLITILAIINAFNLIDGIDGLAGSLGALITATLGCWFFLTDHYEYAIMAFATMGAVLAFLRYNFTPAKIFMGDTGSMLIGVVCAVLIIKFIEINYQLEEGHAFKFDNIPAVSIGIMILPLYDTARVFVTRILRGYSPFHADRRHIHHLLIDYGLSHMRATAILVFVNLLFICFVFSFHDILGLHLMLILLLSTVTALTYMLHRAVLKVTHQVAGQS